MKKISEQVLFEGDWLSVHQMTYANKAGLKMHWETVRRKRSRIGVVVVAQMMPSKKFVVIKQYRPAINGYILSFPAGLGDGDPNHALVELKEETGYVGTIVSVSPVLKTGASLIDDNAYIVYAHVDENAKENQRPVQELEDAEDISVHLVSRSQAKEFFAQEMAQGTQMAANLWYVFHLADLMA